MSMINFIVNFFAIIGLIILISYFISYVIDYIKQQLGPLGYRSYLEGTAIKYLHRFKYKTSNIQDLEKCVWYIRRLIKELENM